MVGTSLRKRCPRCKKHKELGEFTRNKDNKDGLSTYCRSCHNEYVKARYHSNPTRARAAAKVWRAANRKRHNETAMRCKYGITRDDFDRMSTAQGDVCAICGRTETRRNKNGVYRLHIDHDHETGRIRALLCHHCNAGLGHFKDDPKLLEAAAAYLRNHGR